MKFKNLMSEGKIGSLVLPNRIVYPPIQNRAADEKGHIRDNMIDYFALRAENGAGLITVQHSFCWPAASLPHGVAMWDDSVIPSLKKLSDAVHKAGGKIAIQLGGRGTRQDNDAKASYAPSSIQLSYEKDKPQEVTVEQIEYFLEMYGKAAQRAAEGGFDAVEIHAAHGKLISQFLSPYTNRRTDEYGGSVEKRCKFPAEIIKVMSKANLPIIFRMSLIDCIEGGTTLEEGLEQVKILDKAGADAFHISSGMQEKMWNTDHSYFFPYNPHAELSIATKKVTDKPVIIVSRVADAFAAEEILEKNQADFVALGRPLLADPFHIKKAMEQDKADIRRCVYCLNCTTWTKRPEAKERGIVCTVNPELLREKEFSAQMTKVTSPKKIMVAGGGLAGMQAAATLAERGHIVSLYEKNAYFGGQWHIASYSHHRSDFRTLVPYLKRQLEKYKVDFHLETEVTEDLLAKEKPDHLLIATGGVPRDLVVDSTSSQGPNLVQAFDCILGIDKERIGQRVAVVGGRYIGMEVAIQLAKEGKHVSIIEAFQLGHGTVNRLLGMYRNLLVENDVHIFDNSPVLRTTSTGIDIAHCGSMLSLPCDTVVTAIGTVPLQVLKESAEKLGVQYTLIGDSNKIGDAVESISDGATIGRTL